MIKENSAQLGILDNRFSITRLIFTVLLLFTTFTGIFIYAYQPLYLTLSLFFYAGILYYRPMLWLLLLPSIMTWINLAPWSGSFFLEELDLFLLVTIIVLLLRRNYTLSRMNIPGIYWFAIGLYLCSWAISLFSGLFPLTHIDANAFSNYYSHYNALRIGKALLLGLLFIPAISYSYRTSGKESFYLFSWGMAIAAMGIGIIALWERGVFTQLLYSNNKYAIINSLLNFSTDYRITGLFAEMHTGGEAIDGFLALTLPFTLFAAIHGKKKTWLWGIAAALLGFYAAAVTFSRATYLSSAVIIVTLALIAFIRTRHTEQKISLLPLFFSLILLGLLAFEFHKGGSLLLFSSLLAYISVALAGFSYKTYPLKQIKPAMLYLFFFLNGIFVTYWAAKGMLTSKWAQTEQLEAILFALVTGIAVVCTASWTGLSLSRKIKTKNILAFLFLFAGAGATLIPALFGSRMETRFSTVGKDISTRTNHWQKALSIMDNDLTTQFFGMGLGQFPDVYFWKHAIDKVGVYQYKSEQGNQFLSMRSGKDLRYAQRIAIDANTAYTLSLDARAHADNLDLRIRICRRHIIEPTEWNPNCLQYRPDVKGKEGNWHHYNWEFNSKMIGDGIHLINKPLVIELSNLRQYVYASKPPRLVDIDNIQITDKDGNNYLRNGDFSKGAQAWYPYFDFNHLPWHIKNIWVSLYFEQGMLGVLSLIFLVFLALLNGIRQLRKSNFFTAYFIASVLAFFTVGLFGTLVDVPRVMFLFYIIIFSLLLIRPYKSRSAKSGST